MHIQCYAFIDRTNLHSFISFLITVSYSNYVFIYLFNNSYLFSYYFTRKRIMVPNKNESIRGIWNVVPMKNATNIKDG